MKAIEPMKLNVGILIIGSLWWREDRQPWRDARLRMDAAQTVTAPIRYGRKSQSWGDAYTMVLSPSCEPGNVKAVPCLHPVTSIDDLILEAECLWKAEQPAAAAGRLSANWGLVGVLKNPERTIPADLLKAWAVRIANEEGYERLSKSMEGGLIGDGGFLQIDWPHVADSTASADFDLLLATATKPTVTGKPPSYASVETMTDAWNAAGDHVRYFWMNVDNGIKTFQDDDIRKRLNPREERME